MPQEIFIPTEGVSTHLEARNVINSNANDAEVRIANLESRLDLEPHNINSSYGEGETFYFGGSSYRVDDGATLNVGESPTTNPEKVTILDNAGLDGKTVLNGIVVPTTEGVDGDFYIKTDSSDIYGPKTGGSWGPATSLIGADGAVGADGAAGADGADGADNATLESVTTNGATTVNNISVGTIATLHPTNTANDNVATGQQSASIGGRRNIASGTRATTFGGVSNTVSGTDSTAVGGNNQEVIGVESEALGSTNLFLYTKYTSALGTANSKVGLATSAATSVEAKHSVIVGGEAQTIEDAAYAAILGGAVNKVLSTHDRSVILGGANIITDASDTAYVPSLNIKSGFKMPTGASNTYVLTSDANGVGTWQAAAGGPAGPSGTVLSGTTANATPTEIFVDGTSPNRVDVATGSTITFSALVAARSATESAGYKIEGVIKNDAGTAALVGVVAKTVFAEEDIAWDITVTAANNALTFIVTGDSADSVSWEVTLNKTEAT